MPISKTLNYIYAYALVQARSVKKRENMGILCFMTGLVYIVMAIHYTILTFSLISYVTT